MDKRLRKQIEDKKRKQKKSLIIAIIILLVAVVGVGITLSIVFPDLHIHGGNIHLQGH